MQSIIYNAVLCFFSCRCNRATVHFAGFFFTYFKNIDRERSRLLNQRPLIDQRAPWHIWWFETFVSFATHAADM